MRSRESPEHAAIRAEARAWLEEHFPAWKRSVGLDEGREPTLEEQRSWQRTLADGGWGAPAWPVEHGGRGFGPVESAVWQQEKARARANFPFNVPGFGMAGPTIIAHGTEEQKDRCLGPMLRGDEIWCQLFSEPGAGSDLAALTTRAVRDGDDWVVTGQKVWSSGAGEADWGILLARSDFDVPKHRGLVYLLVDMHGAGVDVRPLRQMDGGSHFSEVFLSEVRVPDANRVGEPGEGWKVAVTTLMHERVSLGAATAGFAVPFESLVDLARDRPGDEFLTRQALSRVYTQNRILEFLNERILSKLAQGQIPDAEGSIMKLVLADLVTDSATVGVGILGSLGMIGGHEGIQRALLGSKAFHLGGGTDEVQRNLIAERVLGMPRDPRPDKDVPFRETLGGGPA
ncbi:MAG: acyl-CoA dehydrogenase family protein [Actinomycetota bacterium]